MRTTSSRDNWERLVAAVIKREQIWQLCHQDSITTVDSDFTQRYLSLRSVPSSSSRLPLATDSVVQDIEVRKNGSGTITQKIFSALLWRKKHKGKELVGIPERRESQPPLGWETRLRIALGVARGLDYLHHGCIMGIIHRDVKAANILLDEDFEAVVSDFSLAIFMDNIDDDAVRGTFGHIAPEYLSRGKWSLETDVFGYGIFLLELITAQWVLDLHRLANDGDLMLLDWVKKLLEEKESEIIVDPYLGGNYVEEEAEKLFQIALICTQTDPEGRPMMSEIMRMLEYGDGLDEGWEKFKNVYQDENYSSKLHPSAEWIITDSGFSFNAEELSGPR